MWCSIQSLVEMKNVSFIFTLNQNNFLTNAILSIRTKIRVLMVFALEVVFLMLHYPVTQQMLRMRSLFLLTMIVKHWVWSLTGNPGVFPVLPLAYSGQSSLQWPMSVPPSNPDPSVWSRCPLLKARAGLPSWPARPYTEVSQPWSLAAHLEMWTHILSFSPSA